jgi:hypothetical protein
MAQGEAPVVAARQIQRIVGEDRSIAEYISGLVSFGKAADTVVERLDKRDREAGAAARQAGMSKNEKASAAWAEGYQRADAALAGDADGEEMLQGVLAGQDIGMSSEGYIQQVYKLKTRGMVDGPFKAAYDTAFAAKADRLRTLFADRQREQVIAKAEEDTQALIDKTFEQFLSKGAQNIQRASDETEDEYLARVARAKEGADVPDAIALQTLYQHAKSVGVTGARFNAMLLATANLYGNRGVPEAFEALKADRADGTPSMYRIPEFKKAIDEGQQMAERVQADQRRQELLRLKAEREQRREDMLAPIYTEAFAGGDLNKARVAFEAIVRANPGLFNADDVYKHADRLKRVEAKVETEEERLRARDLVMGIYSGATKWKDVVAAELPLSLQNMLVEKWQSWQDRTRQGEDRHRKLSEEYVKGARVQGHLNTLKNLDSGINDPFSELDGEQKNKYRLARVAAENYFMQAVEDSLGMPDPAKRDAYIDSAAKQALSMFDNQVAPLRASGANAGSKPPSITSRSPEDAIARARRGEITAQEAERQVRYFQKNPQHIQR